MQKHRLNLYTHTELNTVLRDNIAGNEEYEYLLEKAQWHKVLKFLSYIYVFPLINKRDHQIDSQDFWVPLSRNILVCWFGSGYKRITEVLEKLNVIESTSYQAPNERSPGFCKSYKLNEEYRSPGAWKLSSFFYNESRFINKMINHKLQKEEDVPFKKIMKDHLMNLTIDSKKAYAYILNDLVTSLYDETNLKDYAKVVVSKWEKGKLVEDYTVETHNKFVRALAVILNDTAVCIPKTLSLKKKLIKGDISHIKKYKSILDAYNGNYYSISAISYITSHKEATWTTCKNGRLHTNLTNLSRNLRQYLSLNGMPILAPDIACSQPLFYALVLSEKYKGKEMPKDVAEFIYETTKGRFYNIQMDRAGIFDESKRDAYKKSFFGNVFFNEIPLKLYDQALQFKQYYPTIWKHICEEKANDYRDLANKLQRTESSLIIDKVCKRLVEMGIPCLSLHDAIYSYPENYNIIAQEILKAFKETYSITPTLKAA